jgi:hypothetical protein
MAGSGGAGGYAGGESSQLLEGSRREETAAVGNSGASSKRNTPEEGASAIEKRSRRSGKPLRCLITRAFRKAADAEQKCARRRRTRDPYRAWAAGFP